MIFLFIILATFAGLPPFIGFWPKILLVWQLNYATEWLLLLVTISTSVFVMFYYFYNYRFFNNDAKFSLLTFLQPKYIRISALFITLFFSNCSSILFFNDLWNSLETICQLYEFYSII
jgi:NADH:ubiquinone oxidoreductase subunit 2 (subunit N)